MNLANANSRWIHFNFVTSNFLARKNYYLRLSTNLEIDNYFFRTNIITYLQINFI